MAIASIAFPGCALVDFWVVDSSRNLAIARLMTEGTSCSCSAVTSKTASWYNRLIPVRLGDRGIYGTKPTKQSICCLC